MTVLHTKASRSRATGPLTHALRCAALVACILPVTFADEMPASLGALVLQPRHRPVTTLELAGVPFEALTPFSSLPFIAWPCEAGPPPFAKDFGAAAAWLERAASGLGLEGIEIAFDHTERWRGDEVWAFSLRHRGIPLRNASVDLHWNGDRLVGLVDRLPAPIQSIEEVDAATSSGDLIYHPVRVAGGVRLVLARLEIQAGDRTRRVVTRALDGSLLATLIEPTTIESVGEDGFEFREFPVRSGGGFPDQISLDSNGRVWFSQPFDDILGSFHPGPERFRRFQLPVTARGPDGLTVDREDRVWTGLFFGGGLGRFEIATEEFSHFEAPYADAALAIPNVTRSGDIWVTDHGANRISRFDPATNSWLDSFLAPTPNSWLTAGAEDVANQRVFFTQFNVAQLAVAGPGTPPTEIPVVGQGPAFLAISDGRVYYSQWSTGRLGVYDIATGQSFEYAFPDPQEFGGPLGKLPNGDIVIGTRSDGVILVFDISEELFTSYPIPTTQPGLKDGLVVDKAGRIWFTESSVGKIARLEIF